VKPFSFLAFALLFGYGAEASVVLLDKNQNAIGEHVTLAACVQAMSPGQICEASAATYPERVTVSGSGTPDAPLTIRSRERRGASSQGFVLTGSYIVIDGFTVDSVAAFSAGILVQGSDIRIVNNHLKNVQGNAAIDSPWESHSQRISVKNNLIEDSQYGLFISGDSWVVENNEVSHLVKSQAGDADYCRFWGEGHLIRYNYFHGAALNHADAHVDCFQTFDKGSKQNYARNIVIERNICINFHQAFMGEAHNVQGSNTITFRRNIFAHTLDIGDGMNIQDIPNMTIENNVFHDIQNIGVLFSTSNFGLTRNGLLRNNIFSNILSASYYLHDASNLARNNLLFNAGTSTTSTDIQNTNPQFQNATDIVGADGVPFTADDGLRVSANSAACGAGEKQADIGAYPCGGKPFPPTQLRLR